MASSSPKRPRPSPSLATRSAASAKAIFTHELTRGVYQSLKEDVVRMEAYTAAIERACPGKRVLDIGTGPEALLAIVAARAGATAVIAVEVSDAAAAAAREAVRVAGLEGMITVLAGYSTELDLPAVDVVIHEIVGDLGSEEGIAAVLRDLQDRGTHGGSGSGSGSGSGGGSGSDGSDGSDAVGMGGVLAAAAAAGGRPQVVDTTKAGWSVPRRVDTFVAPINLRLPCNDAGEGPPEVRLPMVPPTPCLLGDRALLESIDMEAAGGIEVVQNRTLTWVVRACDDGATCTGFVCAPRIELDAETAIDAWTQRTSWRSVLVNLIDPVVVHVDDEVELSVKADLRAFPVVHTFDAAVIRNGEQVGRVGGGVREELGQVRVCLDNVSMVADEGEKGAEEGAEEGSKEGGEEGGEEGD
jgi:SAM-dependent methyltransferase